MLRHPRRMLAYAGRELHDAPERQYSDTLQPSLFLVLSDGALRGDLGGGGGVVWVSVVRQATLDIPATTV